MIDRVDIDAVSDELSALARLRNRLEFEPARFPSLVERASALAIGGPAGDAVFELIDRAIARLDDGRRQAASCLLADGPDRWNQNLKTRSTAAAAHLGIGSYHTFRDRRNGPSPSDELISAVAVAVAALESVEATEGDGGSGIETERSGDLAGGSVAVGSPGLDSAVGASAEIAADPQSDGGGGGWSRLPIVAAIAVSAVVVLGSVVWLAGDRSGSTGEQRTGADVEAAEAAEVGDVPGADEPAEEREAAATEEAGEDAPSSQELAEPTTTEVAFEDGTVGASEAIPVDGCDIPLGGSVTPTPDQRQVAEAIAAAVEVAGGIEMTGCPMHSIERWQTLWVQAFGGERAAVGGLPPGSVLVDEGGLGVWVEEGVVSGYRTGMSGTLQFVSGTPVGFRSEGEVQILELSDGALVVAEVPGNRAFWLAAEAADDWLAAGGVASGLGPPLTDPNFIDGRPEQHFRYGRIWEGEPGQAILEIVTRADVEAYLDRLGPPLERLVRTFDSTAWWIDADGVRRWIPDGDTWWCVGGADVQYEEETPGWVIGSFPAGPPMSCDDVPASG